MSEINDTGTQQKKVDLQTRIVGLLFVLAPVVWFVFTVATVEEPSGNDFTLAHVIAIALMNVGIGLGVTGMLHPWLNTVLVFGCFPFLMLSAVSLVYSMFGIYYPDLLITLLSAAGVLAMALSIPLFIRSSSPMFHIDENSAT